MLAECIFPGLPGESLGAAEAAPECCVQRWDPQDKRGGDRLERVRGWATKGMEHEAERAGAVQPVEGSRGSWQCAPTPDGMEGGRRSHALLSSAHQQGKRPRAQMKHIKPHLHTRKHTFCYCEGGSNTGTGCTERLWSLQPWSYSKSNRTWSCTTGSAGAGGVDSMTSRDPFPPQLLREFTESQN